MLQPRKLVVLFIGSILICADFVKGVDFINTSPRKRRQDVNDVTTVLLVDNHGRSSFGRFLNVKPDLGVITSTARTFIQDGVTTEYATQVLGTTLDHGRLYAHLLTKSSRVLYDHKDPHSKSHYPSQNWNIEDNLITARNFIKNTDYIQPSHVETFVVLPTTRPTVESQDVVVVEEELLNEEPSTNPRIIYQDDKQIVLPQNNVKAYKINPYIKDLTHENIIAHNDGERGKKILTPSKIQGWDHLPTFTVRNEFSPSGYSFLGDFSDFDSNTERTSKLTTAADRRAKLLFKAGLLKPERRELHTTTYMGFADFTTTVGDTVIVFAPFTSQVDINTPKVSVTPTIRPTLSLDESKIIRPTLSYQKPVSEETTSSGGTHKSTKIIDKYDRSRDYKVIDESIQVQREDMEAKSSVLAHEQKQEGFPSAGSGAGDSSSTLSTSSGRSTIFFSPEVIQPSESQASMLSTPSNEDIAKIFASLQAKEAQTATEPLSSASASTIFFDDSPASSSVAKEDFGGATTIFFEEDLPILNTIVENQNSYNALTTEEATTESIKEDTTTAAATTTTSSTTTTTTEKQTTTTEKQTTTTEKQTTTTEQEIPTTTNEITTTTENIETTTTNEEEKEQEEIKEVDVSCTDGARIIPTTVYRTLTYLTTFFIPDEDTTSTSVNANEVTSTEIGFETRPCSLGLADAIQPASVTKVTAAPTVLEETTTLEEPTAQEVTTKESVTAEITTESRHVTESEPVTTEETTESGEEIELIFKTLYTTYTYLTTYFQDSTSSVDSRIVVTTNVITSTIEPGSEASEIEQFNSEGASRTFTFEDLADISPTSVLNSVQATSTSTLSDDRGDTNQDLYQPTPSLDDNLILQTLAKGLKTYYTTYTYFTTIFVDGETEISSRTEVFTNYITPTASGREITPTKIDHDFDDVKNQLDSPEVSLNVKHSNSYNTTINRKKTLVYDEDNLNNIITSSVNKEQSYVTLQRGTTEESIDDNNLLDLSDYETISTMVTDVRSSTSEGDRRIIDNLDKRNILDDQIVSESNNDSEIIPSPTLLLQTSYTTFTYFTTMYHGTTSSNIVSRLETITNVVTETLTPTHTLSVEDQSLPITYFTTYTYWTTYYKDGTTKVTSSEVTVSNIVTPTPVITATLPTVSILPSQKPEETSSATTPVQPSLVGEDDLTTYFTTYTYYTTSYIGDSTVLNSRLETITNVLNKTNDIESNTIGKSVTDQSENNKILKPTGLISTILNTVDNSGTKTILSTGVYGTYIDGVYAQVLESSSTVLTETIQPSSVSLSTANLKPTGIVSINKGKIVDAEGVSTLFYTTQAVGTYIDDSYAQVIESTSSLQVDEVKKAALPTDLPIIHKTGLVRLIEGSIVQNKTTTLYQSKVIGTIIDGRYAQIIESTSSFLLATPSSISPSNVPEISATPTQAPGDNIAPTSSISPSPVVIEGSLSDSSKIDEESTTEFSDEEQEEEEEDGEGNSRTRSRLTFQTKKRTFTPVIRPFASRPRPTFAPKRKNAGASTATTVTRSDFTPTVTAVPASKSSKFGGRRSSANPNQVQPTPTGSRRFGRPKSTSGAGGRRSSSRIQPTSTLGSSRRSGFRTSGISGSRASSLFGSSNRFRIRPTSTLKSGPSSSSGVTPSSTDKEENNDITTSVTDSTIEEINEDGETILPTTTETSSTKRNPLIRLRRPPLNRPVARSTTPRSGRNINRGSNKAAAITTPKPKTTRPSGLLGRSRSNALFPRRGLFTTTTTTTPAPGEESEEDLEEDIEGSENDDDVDYDSSQRSSRTAPPPPEKTRPGNVKIRPFSRSRPRRDAYSRYRRPTSRSSTSTTASSIEEVETETPRSRYKGRYSSRNKNKSAQTTTSAPTTRKRISPSKAQGRTQFTLREKDSQSHSRASYKRPSTRTRPTTISSRPKSPRLKTTTEPPSRRKTGTSSNRRPSTRRGNVRPQHEEVENYVLPDFDGTITVTHHIPTEVTIPVVNGKITEYKNIITAKTSTEVVGPKGYSTTINPLGKQVTVLLEESTSVDPNGATLITQFLLDETPTTSVIFTPTYIRGRKTSFSHIIPSTVYGVENVVETIQPALAAQAPLANILLSQLLLGGVPPQNYGLNPGAAATPTTEYKTRTTTYVTTVINSKSTVIPLTFRGKEILTTIADTSTQVVTATEFITDTIVVTPTLPTNQLNTLLLPLLQQQLQQQSGMLQQQQQLNLNLNQPANVYHLDPKLLHEPQKFNLNLGDDLTVSQKLEDSEETESEEQETTLPVKKSFKRKQNKPAPAPVPKPKETSVVTLYVSGRTPGEFSTVLSTYVVDASSNLKRRKREIEVSPSQIYEDSLGGTEDYLEFILPASRDLNTEQLSTHSQTQSLDSVFGAVGKRIRELDVINTQPTQVYKGKSRMNLTDLNEKAPLMPKVETFSSERGNQHNYVKNYVSNFFGNNDNQFRVHDDLGFNVENFDEIHLRIKRDSSADISGEEDVEDERSPPAPAPAPAPARRRVVKKLIRVEPVNKELKDSRNTHKRKHRRRLLIKKKKRKLKPFIDNEAQERPRKTIVVTKKRLLNRKTETEIEPTEIQTIFSSFYQLKTADTLDLLKTNNQELDDHDVDDDDQEIDIENISSIENYIESEENYQTNTTSEDNNYNVNITRTSDENYIESYESNNNTYTTKLSEMQEEQDQDATTPQTEEEYHDNYDYQDPQQPQTTPQHVPDYEPSFPELTESFLDAPVLILKTSVLSSVELLTRTLVTSRLRTYTFIVTTVAGTEQIVTSTTEVRPQIKTTTVTEPFTRFTTLTLLDLDPAPSSVGSVQTEGMATQERGRAVQEARYNHIATRVMSNGVEVIVAGDKSTLPGEPDILRVLPTNIYKPVTLRPSTLTDHMMMIKPEDSQEVIRNLSESLYPNKFVTKTCMTTFTYLTTYLQNGTTTVSSHEQVVSNIATEERVNPTDVDNPEMGITLTQNPNLSVGIYHTTYTYLNTIIDGEQPLVVTSTHTVTNTVTAPQDYLSLLQPSETMTPQRDTNTYYSTVTLEKLISEGSDTRMVSTNEVLTQVVITESVPPKATSVMTSYIALDMEDGYPNQLTTTDMVKTYFVTYTYYNTIVENGSTTVRTNVSTSSDVVTEKLFLQPKKTTRTAASAESADLNDRVDNKGFELLATKTYLTTFTYFTTLLQEENSATPTVISSRSRIVENVITETIDPNLLDQKYLNGIKSKINDGAERVTKLATLKDGQEIELTAVVNEELIQPTQVLPIDRTTMPTTMEASQPSVITGSTIIFEDDDPFANILQSTPTLQKTSIQNNLHAMLSSEIVKTTTKTSKSKTKLKTKIAPTSIKQVNPTKVKSPEKIKQPVAPAPAPAPVKNEAVPDLLGLGSNYMENLRPVINAVADLIQTNLKSSPKHPEALPLAPQLPLLAPAPSPPPATQTTPKIPPQGEIIKPLPPEDNPPIENRPIYIPVNFANDYEVAESQNVETYLQDTVDGSDWNKYTKESPLINGGIPISPGDVITAHSDVIVGKPGRTMPRIPQIQQVKPDEDIGMRPPPIHRNDEYKHIPINSEKPTVVIHAPNRDDYVGPPPPRVRVRGEKHKHIPLNVNRVYAQDRPYEYVDVLKPPASGDPLVYAESQNYAHFRQNELDRERENHNRSISLDNPINKFNINPTIVLPEVIERATGQPLLVNIQPSQVAFVNIPHNRTTAFVYGGSTELHKNGQYFDDPSPYPQSEFSVVENNNRPQTSIYNIQGNQKQVKGVMKVENSLINNRPNGDVSINIAPTRLNNRPQDHEININVAPISFGMIQQGNDFNAHIIRHDEMEFQPPPLSYQVTKEVDYPSKQSYSSQNNHVQSNKPIFIPTVENLDKINNINRLAVVAERPPKNSTKNYYQFPQDDTTDLKPPLEAQSKTKQPPPPPQQQQQQSQPPNRKYNSNRPQNEIVDYMIPPPYKPRPHRKPLPIPISQTNFKQSHLKSNQSISDQRKDNNRYKEANHGPYVRSTTQKSTTKEKIPLQTTRVQPIIFNPRPFGTQLIVRPENQQTNQVNNFDSQRIVEINFNKYREPDQHHVDLFMNTMKQQTPHNRPVKDNSRFEVSPTLRNNTSSQFVYPDIFVITNKPSPRPTSKISTRPTPSTRITTTTPTTTRKNVKNKYKNQRPKVTSLPIDVPTTFKPTIKSTNKEHRPGPFVTVRTTPKPKLFNTGEVLLKFRNISEEINDLEMMKPPPRMPAHIPKKPSLVELKRPIHKDEVSTPGPFIVKGSDEVVGMSPPPVIYSTTSRRPPTTTTQKSRRPFTRTRRPGRRTTTTTVPPTTRTSYKPLYRRTTAAGRNRSTSSSSTSTTGTGVTFKVTKISPTPTFKLTSPTLITGDDSFITEAPNKNDQESQESKHQVYVPPPPVRISSSVEPPINPSTRKTNINTSSSISTAAGNGSSSSIGSAGSASFSIHHAAGNKESKTRVIDASTVSATPPLPTKYITYTTTATLTITKTIVLTTSGGPPSTTTILITTTETSTIIDTITQTQTLIKPTSITQTVTTTIQNSLYPSDIYRSSYPPIHKEPIVIPTVTIEQAVHDEDISSNSGSLEDFIITETDPPFAHEPIDSGENESIFVVMTDKNKGSIVRVPPTPANTTNSYETQDRDEVLTANEVNNILLGGIFINNPSFEIPNGDKCDPECQPTRNELCQKVNNIMKCVCRPGFARMFPDRPCIPTYTYNVRLVIGGYGHQELNYHHSLTNPNSTEYRKLAQVTHEALDRMVMQSDLRDIYHGVHIQAFEPFGKNETEIISKFYLQLSAATPIPHLLTILLRYLHHHNNTLGGTPLRTSTNIAPYQPLNITDFDECAYPVMHDCSEHAQCFNLPGTYTCSCREGHEDVSGNAAYPGRVCSGERGCERCHWRGKCFGEGESERCQCERWYTGETCQVNLKVLLIALATLGAVLILLLFTCLVMTCLKRKPSKAHKGPGIGFLPQRAATGGKRGTLDRRAMIPDSSSEDSRSERDAVPYVAKPTKKPLQKRPPKGALKKPIIPSAPTRSPPPPSGTLQSMGEQKDRSLPVLIPRARFQRPPQPPQPPRPPQLPPNPLQHYTTFDAGQPSVPSVATQESKLLSYLDAGPSNKATASERPVHPHPHPPRKLSSTHSDSLITEDKRSGSRKTSGALVSAGFEVSATVGCHTYRTCGTEADRSENATLVPRMSVDMMSEGGGSQFNTFRKRAMEDEMEQIDEDWMDLEPRIITMSEVRSCDETTIPPPVRTMRDGDYNTNNSSSQQQNDEANTMAERDLGSTFILPHTHLYKPDRGSDISGFESL